MSEPPVIAMVPAYGGMFRPPPPKRWPKVLAVLAILLVAVTVGILLYRRHVRSGAQPRPDGDRSTASRVLPTMI